jgi:hypothetical protein
MLELILIVVMFLGGVNLIISLYNPTIKLSAKKSPSLKPR